MSVYLYCFDIYVMIEASTRGFQYIFSLLLYQLYFYEKYRTLKYDILKTFWRHNLFCVLLISEEWITRKKSEVTTTRQIATRVKREVVLEDGRILKDSGPKISTSVNEDTHTTNFQQTEVKFPILLNRTICNCTLIISSKCA